MSWLPSILLRPHSGALIVLGTSALGGAAYRYSSSSSSDASLNPHSFTPYTLVHKQPVSSTSAIFTLRNREGGRDPESLKEGWKRSVWSVQVKQPQLQIARAYTPLPPLSQTSPPSAAPESHNADGADDDAHASEDLRLLIRKEEGGEVSTYLHTLAPQSTVELRGPNTECELPHDIKEVIFLAGGTGIAPAMQVARALGQRAGSRMWILWANRRREECAGGVSDGDEGDGETVRMLRLQPQSTWWRGLFWGRARGTETVPLHTQRQMQTLVGGHSSEAKGKGIIVQELESLKTRGTPHTRGLSISYYVDEENHFISPGDVAKRLHVDAQSHHDHGEKGSKVILVSGPDGFIAHWAGKKLWVGGREVQGPLGGVLGQMDLGDWRVFKL
ncbi:uncharacterized protein BDR25DRAFT_303263 [Lindgomyces ingoldianus]|uniref:Uncharacterized protein n=1 Tax=Lindgomyces ingoldianus TaxID=673940 RepID=A0ACB6QX97_9PLEO|nr:uncharacterized protein BDR25DRAFT_303263 [Lindgomyces ingoldianus]KAF2471130.1 hypothetical protein BDR25DRAFT_303263 [Lindgomyces ingoldianus]